jgi:CO/xanthine dehydrogenase FAD-binding subunit
VAALAAYDATVVVQSARGERKIPIADLQTGYKKSTREGDEVIVAVEIALPKKGSPRGTGARWGRAARRPSRRWPWPAWPRWRRGVAVRFGLGMASVGPVTAQLWNTRALVQSKPLRELGAEEVDRAVESDITPIDDVRSTGEYRLHVAKSVVRDFARALGARV